MNVEYNNDGTERQIRGFRRNNRQYISKLISVDWLSFRKLLGGLCALGFTLDWIGLLLFTQLLFLDHFNSLFFICFFFHLLLLDLLGRGLFFRLFLFPIDLILVFFEDDRVEVDFANKRKLFLRLQTVEKHAILVLLSSQYQISDFELLFIHKLEHLLDFTLLLRHNQNCLSSLFQQPLEQPHNQLRLEPDGQKIRADDAIIQFG